MIRTEKYTWSASVLLMNGSLAVVKRVQLCITNCPSQVFLGEEGNLHSSKTMYSSKKNLFVL